MHTALDKMLVLIDAMHFDERPESQKLEQDMERALKKLREEVGVVDEIVREGDGVERRERERRAK
jgi:hypothetical protein